MERVEKLPLSFSVRSRFTQRTDITPPPFKQSDNLLDSSDGHKVLPRNKKKPFSAADSE